MSKMLGKVEQNRRKMLLLLGKNELLKEDWKRLVHEMGYDRSKRAMDPARHRPPVDNTVGSMRKWAQAALNVVLGTKLRVDGVSGPITRQIIKRFQRREGISAHGYLDEVTLQALELRVGIRAPRSEGHEAIPHLLRLPRKGVWKPPTRRDDKAEKTKKAAALKDADLQKSPQDKTHDKAHDKNSERQEAQDHHPGILQTEAEQAVRATVFDPVFVEMAAERKHGQDPAVLKSAMKQWLDEAMNLPQEDAPLWTDKVRRLARRDAVESASVIRRQWWEEHVEESL